MTAHTRHTDDATPTGERTPVVPGDLFARHQTITGLRALADFLEANPAVPVNEFGHDLIVSARTGDDASAAALVDQAAEVLGVTVDDETGQGGHYTASRSFGRITYRLVHIPQHRRDQYRAQDSYRNNITLDPDQNDQDGDQSTGRAA